LDKEPFIALYTRTLMDAHGMHALLRQKYEETGSEEVLLALLECRQAIKSLQPVN
jgi:hypothetical protein